MASAERLDKAVFFAALVSVVFLVAVAQPISWLAWFVIALQVLALPGLWLGTPDGFLGQILASVFGLAWFVFGLWARLFDMADLEELTWRSIPEALIYERGDRWYSAAGLFWLLMLVFAAKRKHAIAKMES